jgi:predicted helicase
MGEYRSSIYAKLVKKVGSRSDMENWAFEVAEIGQGFFERITRIIETPGENQELFQGICSKIILV